MVIELMDLAIRNEMVIFHDSVGFARGYMLLDLVGTTEASLSSRYVFRGHYRSTTVFLDAHGRT